MPCSFTEIAAVQVLRFVFLRNGNFKCLLYSSSASSVSTTISCFIFLIVGPDRLWSIVLIDQITLPIYCMYSSNEDYAHEINIMFHLKLLIKCWHFYLWILGAVIHKLTESLQRGLSNKLALSIAMTTSYAMPVKTKLFLYAVVFFFSVFTWTQCNLCESIKRQCPGGSYQNKCVYEAKSLQSKFWYQFISALIALILQYRSKPEVQEKFHNSEMILFIITSSGVDR